MIDDELLTYLDIYYLQIQNIIEKGTGKNTPTSKRFEMRLCTYEDFGFDDNAKEMFEAWSGYHLICPDLPTKQSLYMKGGLFDAVNDVWTFNIDKCSGDKCKTKKEIIEFIADVQIDTWEIA